MGRGGRHRAGDKDRKPFQLSFNDFLNVDFQGSRVTSDGGLLLVRELDEPLGLGKLIDEHLRDSRLESNKKFPPADLVRQSVYSRLAGYEDLNDAGRVCADPTFRLIGSKQNWDRGAALTWLERPGCQSRSSIATRTEREHSPDNRVKTVAP
jgi:hypothetical protein